MKDNYSEHPHENYTNKVNGQVGVKNVIFIYPPPGAAGVDHILPLR